MPVIGGSAQPVVVIDSNDLAENGGRYKLSGSVAVKMEEATRAVKGGAAIAIYPVTLSEVVSGKFKVGGEASLPVVEVVDRKVSGSIAIPVYDPTGLLSVVYLLLDRFITDESAPLASPRDAEPGPGTLTLVQTDGQFSISSGKLQIPAQTTPIWGELKATAGGQSRSVGRALLAVAAWTSDNTTWGTLLAWVNHPDSAGKAGDADVVHGIFKRGADRFTALIGTSLVDFLDATPTATDFQLALPLRGTGAHYLVKGGTFSEWTLVWVDHGDASATLYPIHSNHSLDATLDNLRAADLPAPWSDDFGLPHDELTGSLSAGQTFTHPADGRLEFTVDTLPSSGNIDVFFRVEDTGDLSDNLWGCRITSAGTMSLLERNGGQTVRGNALGVLSGGEHIVITFVDETITGYYDGTEAWQYTSATSHKTNTAGTVNSLGTSGAASDLVTYIFDANVPAASGLYTDWLPGSRSAGDTFSHAADCVLEFTVDTLPSSTTINITFRIQDSSNFWRVAAASDGSMTLKEIVAAASTTRATAAAATVTAGSRIVVTADGEEIKVYVDDALQMTYSSAANFKTETAGEIELVGTAGRVSNLVAWDRTITGTALSTLNAV